MGELEKRMLVQHASLGTGKVVALEPNAVHVFFPQRGERFAVKLRLPQAHAFLCCDRGAPDPWLEGTSAFTLDATTGRYGLPATWMPPTEILALLDGAYPSGLGAPQDAVGAGRAERAPAWRAAHESWEALLANGEGERLLAAGEVAELAQRVGRIHAPVSGLLPLDGEPLSQVLRDRDATAALLGGVFEVIGAPASARAPAEGLFAAVARLGLPGPAAWTVATLLPFIAQPRRNVLLHPPTAKPAADRLGCDFGYADAPNWKTYAAFRALSDRLLGLLEPRGARDLADVECFLDVLAHRRSAPKPARAARAAAHAVRPSTRRPARTAKPRA